MTKIKLVKAVYSLTAKFPKEEQCGLTAQMRISAVSIPSNIAEGKMRESDHELRRFILIAFLIAFGSAGELETQIIISKELKKTRNLDYRDVEALLEEVMKMLNSFSSKLKAKG